MGALVLVLGVLPNHVRAEATSEPARQVERARAFLSRERRDSAAVALSAVLAAYYHDPSSSALRRPAVQALGMLGNLYLMSYFDYGKSFQMLTEAIYIAEEDSMTDELPDLYSDMAGLWAAQNIADGKGIEKSVEYMKKAWDAAISSHQPELVINYVVNMCNLDMMSATPCFAPELRTFKTMRFKGLHPELAYKMLYIAATEATLRGDPAEAARLFGQAKLNPPGGRYPERFELGTVLAEADAWRKANDMSRAVEAWRQGLASAQKHGLIDYELLFAENLSKAFQVLGLPDSAGAYEYRSLLLGRQMKDGAHLPDLQERELMAQIDRANTEVRELSVLRTRHEKQLAWFTAFALLVLVCAAFMVWRFRILNRQKSELYRKHQELMDSYRLLGEKTRGELDAKQPAKYNNSPLDREMSDELYERVLRALETSDQVFDQTFNIDALARLVDSRPRLVSQAINEHSGRTFAQMLSQRRMREAAAILADRVKGSTYTIEGVAKSVGLTSVSNFSRAFKASTGLSPSDYRRQSIASRRDEPVT